MRNKIIVIGGIGFSAIHLAEIAMKNHQVEVIHHTEGWEKVKPLLDYFSNDAHLVKNIIVPEIKVIHTRNTKGKLFEPMKSKYHK